MGLGTHGKIGVLGGVIALVGALLPWWNASASAIGVTVSMPVLGIFVPGGILVALFGILGIVFARMQGNAVWPALTAVLGVLTVVFSMVWGAMLPTASVSGGGASASLTAGFGYWISLVGGLVLLVGGIMGITAARKVQAPVPTA